MIVEQNKVVSLSYELRETADDGEFIEKTETDSPFVFLFGAQGVIPGFEVNLAGLKQGDEFSFLIDSKDAYGPYTPEAIVPLEKTVFEEEGKFNDDLIKVGVSLTMRDNNGQSHMGVVTEIGAKTVTMDFNHPMAGKNLHFKGAVLGVREATAEELDHGHVHGPGGHHH